MNGQPQLMQELTRREALLRLGSVPFGRVVFTHRALPAIRPVSHITDNGRVVFGTHEVATILGAAAADHGTVLAYQADDLDPMTRAGWSVVVTGLARVVDDPRDATRYRDAIRPWDDRVTAYVIAIDPEIVTGFELRPGSSPSAF
jgi:pyridoxamine 5'-phosphate oxidase-like protein